METTIALASGRLFQVLNPRSEDICFEDIAESLSKIARFNGHTTGAPYSVAQHSLHVYKIVSKYTDNTQTRLYALLHDAHEALGLCDIPRPVKRALKTRGGFDEYERIQKDIDAAVFFAAGLPAIMPNDIAQMVKLADDTALATEIRDLMKTNDIYFGDLPKTRERLITPWPWDKAHDEFLKTLRTLLPFPTYQGMEPIDQIQGTR